MFHPGDEVLLEYFAPGVEQIASSVAFTDGDYAELSDLIQVGLMQVARNMRDKVSWDYRVWSEMKNYARREQAQRGGDVPLNDAVQKEAARAIGKRRRANNRGDKPKGKSPEQERADMLRRRGYYRREDLNEMLRNYRLAGEAARTGGAGWEDIAIFRADMRGAMIRLARYDMNMAKILYIVGIEDRTVREASAYLGMARQTVQRKYDEALDYLHWILNHKGAEIRE